MSAAVCQGEVVVPVHAPNTQSVIPKEPRRLRNQSLLRLSAGTKTKLQLIPQSPRLLRNDRLPGYVTLQLRQKVEPQTRFWKWFTANQQNYAVLEGKPDVDSLIHEVGDQLRKVDPRLCCEFSANQIPAELIIRADGDESAFPMVEALVENAPSIPNWKIIAFRQRGEIECTIQMGDVELGPAQMWFRLEGDGDNVGLHLYFGGIELNDEVAGAAFILLDNALGEYDMETKVGFIERYQLKPEDDVSQLKPFEKLTEAFDAFYSMTQK